MAYDLLKEASKFGPRRKTAILWLDSFTSQLSEKIGRPKNNKGTTMTVELTMAEAIMIHDACIEEKQRLLGH